MIAFQTLFQKEILRFWKVVTQTVTAPIITALMYLLIFAQVLDGHVKIYGINYNSFLIPGLVMMSILQNAFANTSSSLIQSKMTGNIVFILLPPISPFQMLAAYVLAAIVRGLCVGLGLFLVTVWFVDMQYQAPWWILVFALIGAATLGTMGVIAGIWADKFDQLSAFQNFIIAPATLLAGVFYSIANLPPIWNKLSHFNPFFYMVDGFRHGFFGVSDVSPWHSLGVLSVFFLIVTTIAMSMLRSGYKLRH